MQRSDELKVACPVRHDPSPAENMSELGFSGWLLLVTSPDIQISCQSIVREGPGHIHGSKTQVPFSFSFSFLLVLFFPSMSLRRTKQTGREIGIMSSAWALSDVGDDDSLSRFWVWARNFVGFYYIVSSSFS